MVKIKEDWEIREDKNEQEYLDSLKKQNKINDTNLAKGWIGAILGKEKNLESVIYGDKKDISQIGSNMSDAEFYLGLGNLLALSVVGGIGSNLGARSAMGLEGTKVPYWKSLPQGGIKNRAGRYENVKNKYTKDDLLDTLNETIRDSGGKQLKGKEAESFLNNPLLETELKKINDNPLVYSSRQMAINLGRNKKTYSSLLNKTKLKLDEINKRIKLGKERKGDTLASSRLPIDIGEIEETISLLDKTEQTYIGDALSFENKKASSIYEEILKNADKAKNKLDNILIKEEKELDLLLKDNKVIKKEIDVVTKNIFDSKVGDIDYVRNYSRLDELRQELRINERKGEILNKDYVKDITLTEKTSKDIQTALSKQLEFNKKQELEKEEKDFLNTKPEIRDMEKESKEKDNYLIRKNVDNVDERIRQLEDDLSYKRMIIRRGDGNNEILRREKIQSEELDKLRKMREETNEEEESKETDSLLETSPDLERESMPDSERELTNEPKSKTKTPKSLIPLAVASLLPLGVEGAKTETEDAINKPEDVMTTQPEVVGVETNIEGSATSQVSYSYNIKTTLDRANIDELLSITVKLSGDAYKPEMGKEENYSYFDQFEVPFILYLRQRTLYIGFKGTGDITNVLRDFQTESAGGSNKLNDYDVIKDRLSSYHGDIEFHLGFIISCLESYQIIEDKLKDISNVYDKIIVCGHSLGGAVGQIFSYVYNNSNNWSSKKPIKYLVTYGQPRALFDKEIYIEKYNNTVPNYIRCWNTNDPVPYVPFKKKVFIDKVFGSYMASGFTHVGKSFNLKENLSNNNVNILAYELIQGSTKQLIEMLKDYNIEDTKESLDLLSNKKYLSLLTYCYYENLKVNEIKNDVSLNELENVNLNVEKLMIDKKTIPEKCDIIKPFGLYDLLLANPIVDDLSPIKNFQLSSIPAITVTGNKLGTKAHKLITYQEYINRLLSKQIEERKTLFEIIEERPYINKEKKPIQSLPQPKVIGIYQGEYKNNELISF